MTFKAAKLINIAILELMEHYEANEQWDNYDKGVEAFEAVNDILFQYRMEYFEKTGLILDDVK